MDEEHRDDVGFINFIIDQLLEVKRDDGGNLIDKNKVMLAGSSNGGMMTSRVACNIGNPAYPSLSYLKKVSL